MLRALMAALAFAGVARADESLPAPKGAGVAMQGPFADLDKLCASVACPDLETRVCPLDGDDVKQARTALGEVRLQPINCRAEGIRDGSLTYRFAVRRAEGWWLSSPLFTVGGNDKICAGAVDDLRWETRTLSSGAQTVVARARVYTECMTCSKQGSENLALDLLLPLAAQPGAPPAALAPIVVGEERTQEPLDEDYQCPRQHYQATLRATLGADGSLSVTGSPRWLQMSRTDESGLWPYWARPTWQRSTVGRYRLAP